MTPSTLTPELEQDFAIEAMAPNDELIPATVPGSDETQAFVDLCTECERVCFETANHCLSQGGTLSDVRGIQLLRNCARVCRTSAASWKVGSGLYSQILRAAARLCGECATTCERLTGDRQLKICAEMCRACAEVCERMADRTPEPSAALLRSA